MVLLTLKKYRQLTQKINKNYIAIHDNSLISFKNYKKILKSSGLKFQEVNNVLNLKNTKVLSNVMKN